MKIYRNTNDFKAENPVLTVGTFDGVHLGHRKILFVLTQEALKINGESVVFTLYPHPRKVLGKNSENLFLLNTLDEKIKLLEKAGVKHFIIYPFTKEFANLTACEFINEILYKKLKIKKLIVGYDHRFGKDGQANPGILKQCATSAGIDVLKVDAFVFNEKKISSTVIRKALFDGHIEEANACLGYDYTLSGEVISGNKIGRTIGFPTANIKIPEEKLIPAKGVYAVKVKIEEKILPGMLNIGTKPTVTSAENIQTEVHIFNFSENLYGKNISVSLKKYIRKEIKFPDTETLKQRLTEDKRLITKFFGIST